MFTGQGSTVALMLHWDGTQWSRVILPDPGPGAELQAITAGSATDVWAVGRYHEDLSQPRRTLTMHWDGVQWSIVPSPNNGQYHNGLNAITAISGSDVWAVGT